MAMAMVIISFDGIGGLDGEEKKAWSWDLD